MFRTRIKRIFTIVFLLFVKNIILISIIAYSPRVQSFLANNITKFLVKKYEIDLSVERLYLKIPNKIILTNIYLNDSTGNELLSTDEINISISAIRIFKGELHLDEVRLLKPNINVKIDTNGVANYTYVFNKFLSEEDNDTTSSSNFDIFCEKFSIVNANFKYNDLRNINKKNDMFDLSNMDLNGIDLYASNFKYYSDTIELKIDNFNLKENSGINLKQLSLDFKYYNSGIILDNLKLKTKYSKIISSHIELIGSDSTYLSDPINKLSVNIKLDTIVFDVADLAPFMPEYKNYHDVFYVSGNFSGKLSNIKMKDFNIAYGKNTKLNANLSIDGLPDYNLAFIFGNISKFETTSQDIAKILRMASPQNPIKLPQVVNDLYHISFKGNISGLLNDVVAYGEFNTGLGSIRTDIAIATDFDKKIISANGKIRATDINFGKIIGDSETFGLVSFNTSLNVKIDSLGNYNAKIDCNITNFGMLEYDYTGINISGLASNNDIDGELYVDDPNLQVQFLGKYNYDVNSKENILNVSTDIWANLSNLNLLNDSTKSEIKFVLSSDLHGDFKDIPQGNLNISELKCNFNNKLIKLHQFNLNNHIDTEDQQQYLTLRSDYCDINLYGDFKYNELTNIITNMGHNYLPAFVNNVESIENTKSNVANFNIKFKNINKITDIFIPEINVANDVHIEGIISGNEHLFNATLSMPVISYDSIYIWGSELYLNGYEDSLAIKFVTQEISTGSFPIFENLNLNFDISNNTTLFDLNWDNYDTIKNSGNIKIETNIIKNAEYPIPKIDNHIFNSKFVIQNRLWELSESDININPNDMSVIVKNFLLKHSNQSINISGEVSKDKSKLLIFSINNVDVANINSYIANSGYSVNGILSGNGRVADIYNNPSFRTSLSINNFKINNEDLGRFDLSAVWSGSSNGFNIEGNSKYLKVKCVYTPETDSLDANLLVENFKLEILEPYLNEYDLSNLKGGVNINIIAKGSASNPEISGYVDFDKAELTYDFLKLRVLLDDKVYLTKNSILFKNFKITDELKNPGTINGGLYHNNFSNIKFDFLVNAKKMKLLNTTEMDNSSYYGTAFATAQVRIAGDVNKFGIDAVAKTEPNTIFVLPMNNTYESSGVSFITFVKPSVDSTEVSKIEPLKSDIDFYFKMDIEVTPDAKVQIVFDPKVGDLIKGNAKGNLKMEYTSDQDLYMYGEIEIVEGDYLFTLENIINKKLIITPGGTIVWSGDPLSAILDLNAVYSKKASLKELLMDVADSSEYSKSTNVECRMHMTGELMSPDIKLGIEVPNGSEKAKAKLASMSQDEINKQFVFFLVTNKFFASSQNVANGNDSNGSTNALGTTSFELLSNQVSNWLSQISKDFDIGFKYHPGTEVSGQELEVALSTQILNDRVLINGNVGYGDNKTTSTSSMVGDIEVQLKVNSSGNLRFKGFSKINNDIETEYGPYTSGAGIFYTKDFDTLGELFRDIWRSLTLKNKKDKKIKEE